MSMVKREAIVDAFGNHLVGIALRYRFVSENKSEPPRLATYSSTVITFEGAYYLLTAGHVIQRIDEFYENPEVVVEGCSLVDNFGFSAKHNHVVPFPWRAADRFAHDKDGLDIGLILLSPLFVSNLLANGINPAEEENWRHQHTVTFDGHFLLGLPAELSPQRTFGGGATFQPVGAPVVKLDDLPADIFEEEQKLELAHPQFYAKLREDVALESIVGMSGGPIIGVRVEPGNMVRYWIVAVQSRWYPQHRIIAAGPVPYFAAKIAEDFRRLLGVSQS